MLIALFAVALVQSAPSAFHIKDDVANRRFILALENVGRKTLCLSPATWPNERGFIPLTSAAISVTVGDRTFSLDSFIEDFGTEMVKVRPRNTTHAYLNYAAFKLPEAVATKTKILHLTPTAVLCG